MLKIMNNYYELDLIDIIFELKNQLANQNIYLFNTIKDSGSNIMITCPFHKDGNERKPSCGIRKEDGLLHCFTCRRKLYLRTINKQMF